MSKAKKTVAQIKKQKDEKRLKEEFELREKQEAANAKHRQLVAKGSPLVDMKCIEAYEFFLKNLATYGIPQANIFEFAAQQILKFDKKIKKKQRQIQQIQEYNKQVTSEAAKLKKQQAIKARSPQKSHVPKPDSLLPFKGDLKKQDLAILANQKFQKLEQDKKRLEQSGKKQSEKKKKKQQSQQAEKARPTQTAKDHSEEENYEKEADFASENST